MIKQIAARRAPAACAALAALALLGLPMRADATCYPDGEVIPCTTVDGCAGSRECVGGYFTQCIKDDPSCPQPNQDDEFVADNSPDNEIGILVDGRRAGVEINDEAHVLTPAFGSASQKLGAMEGSAVGVNEVLSFGATRAPTRHSTPWTSSVDRFLRPMVNTLELPITVWILTPPGTFAAQAVRALSTIVQAGALFDQERVGIDFNPIEVRDVTNDPNQSTFQNVTGLGTLEQTIGHVNGRINVYWVQLVNGGSGNGLGEVSNGDSVAVGSQSAPGLLAHEIGHNLALDHVDGDTRFDGTNVMLSAGGTRQFFTEGQAYRAHIRSISAIRSTSVYNLRSTMPIIDTCNINFVSRTCPKVDKRIWADGPNWPAN